MLASWKKIYEKQRPHFANKGPYSQSYGFSRSHVWMWELDHKEGWAPTNCCCQTVVLEKTLESPLDNMKSNQSILKEINPEYSLEGLMLKLNLQYFGHLMWTANSLEKTLMLGKLEGQEKGETEDDSMGMSLSKLPEIVEDKETWCAAVHDI